MIDIREKISGNVLFDNFTRSTGVRTSEGSEAVHGVVYEGLFYPG